MRLRREKSVRFIFNEEISSFSLSSNEDFIESECSLDDRTFSLFSGQSTDGKSQLKSIELNEEESEKLHRIARNQFHSLLELYSPNVSRKKSFRPSSRRFSPFVESTCHRSSSTVGVRIHA